MIYSSISPQRIMTLLCYLNSGNTKSIMRQTHCSSLEYNLMSYSEDAGSAFWFFVAPESLATFHEYCQSRGVRLEQDEITVSVDDLVDSGVKIYIAEQKKGDLIIIPPNSFHQHISGGGLTIQMSWAQMTLQSLQRSLHGVLDSYRRICQKETYRCKLTTFFALKALSKKLRRTGASQRRKADTATLSCLLKLLDEILIEEWCGTHRNLPHYQAVDYDAKPWLISDSRSLQTTEAENLQTCDACHADIFLSYFSCREAHCHSSNGGVIIICVGCAVEGRRCACGNMKPMQAFEFQLLLSVRNKAGSFLGLPPLIEEEIPSSDHLMLFVAACEVMEWTPNRASRCRFQSSGSKHPTLQSHQTEDLIITCASDPCRFYTCIPHLLLSQHIHSAEAIQKSDKFKGYAPWHALHSSSSSLARYKSSLAKYGNDLHLWDIETRLVKVVLDNYDIEPEFCNAAIQPGWYDRKVSSLPEHPLGSNKAKKGHGKPAAVPDPQPSLPEKRKRGCPSKADASMTDHSHKKSKTMTQTQTQTQIDMEGISTQSVVIPPNSQIQQLEKTVEDLRQQILQLQSQQQPSPSTQTQLPTPPSSQARSNVYLNSFVSNRDGGRGAVIQAGSSKVVNCSTSDEEAYWQFVDPTREESPEIGSLETLLERLNRKGSSGNSSPEIVHLKKLDMREMESMSPEIL
ncbi:hypothetical protein SISSUDRAFT_790020 [Sistotremastrum suecicum HHB10207 ss-3]|uniref:JmjC domain-containing protein n=1 Tax=Sistotremastrum suecicum HHB10207 ss-3 TaxID=1314776 RepID=A0A166CZ15_9AGAM|nr:hypothetical protein SISSUDRAFT_790020 [Sistotremastrum suecicum HHB10207 ss-3]